MFANARTTAAPVGVVSSTGAPAAYVGQSFKLGDSRRRHGHRAMRTAHEAAADIDAAGIDLGDAEHVKADGDAADVHDGIGRTDFMERDLVSRVSMHMTLGLGEHLEDAERNRLGAIRERRALNHRTDIAHRAMMMDVMIMMVVICEVMEWHGITCRRFLVHFDINICRRNAVLFDLRDFELTLLHDGELRELAAKDMFIHARHVAAQAGKCIEIDCFCHNFPLSSGG